jgi:hypothetical protein
MNLDPPDRDPSAPQLTALDASWRVEHRLRDLLGLLAGSVPEQRQRLLLWKQDLADRLRAISVELEQAKEVERALDWVEEVRRLLSSGLSSLPNESHVRLERIAGLAWITCDLGASAIVKAVQ